MSSKSIWIPITIQMNCYLQYCSVLFLESNFPGEWCVFQPQEQIHKIARTLKALVVLSIKLWLPHKAHKENKKTRMSHLQWEERVHSSSAWPCAVCEASLLAAEVWSGPHGSCNQMRWLTAVEMGHRLLTFAFWDSHGIHKILYKCNLDSQKGLSH